MRIEIKAWPVIEMVLAVLIMGSGGVVWFYIFSPRVINLDSARYLLSAIIQSLAALMALIFAGVIWMWQQQIPAWQFLYGLRDKYIKLLKEEIPVGKGKIRECVSKIEILLYSLLEIIIYAQRDARFRKGLRRTSRKMGVSPESILVQLLYDYNFHLDIEHFKERIKKEINELTNEPSEARKRLSKLLKSLDKAKPPGKPEKLGEYFMLIRILIHFLEEVKLLDKGFHYGKAAEIIENLDRSLLTDRVDIFVRVITRGKRARRGFLFKLLISWYATTITSGIICLFMLDKVTIASQPAWTVGLPVFLSICAVALTFLYVFQVLAPGKEY